MAITAQANAHGTKTVTSGTTFTIVLNSTAGDCVFVAVCVAASGTCSGVTDGGGNAYDSLGSILSGTGRTYLFKCRNNLASGTITVTVSAGVRACGAAASYRGVAIVAAGATASGAASPATSGAIAAAQSTDFLIAALSNDASKAFTQQNGTIRDAAGATGAESAIMDNTGSTSITDSATYASGNWGMVFAIARSLVIAEDQSTNWNDLLKLIPRQLDNDVTDFFGTSAAGDNWSDVLSTRTTGVLSEDLSDFFGTSSAGDNWNDVLDFTLTTAGLLSLAVNDSQVANWLDSLALGYGIVTSDAMALSDSDIVMELGGSFVFELLDPLGIITIATGTSGSESLNLSDSASRTTSLEILFTDALSLSDSLVLGYGASIVDNQSANWSDNLALGYGLLVTDAQSLSDALQLGYGLSVNDALVLFDGLAVGYGVLVIDNQSANWSDALASLLGIGIVLTDSTSTWLDATALGYGVVGSDALALSDAALLGYGVIVIDDQSGNWSDAVLLAAEFGVQPVDSLALSDTLFVGYGCSCNDSLSVSDAIQLGYGASVFDALVLADIAAFTLSFEEPVTDSFAPSDSLTLGYGNSVLDALSLSDSLNVQLALDVIVTDTLALSDSVNVGVGLGIADQLAVSDSLALGYGIVVTDDQSTNWNDLFQYDAGQSLINVSVSDSFVVSDSLFVGYGSSTSDSVALADAILLGYGVTVSDNQTTWADALLGVLSYLVQISDATPGWGDTVAAGLSTAISASDQLAIFDAIAIGIGNVIAETLSLSDKLALGYGITINDQLTWQDSLSVGTSGTIISQSVIDTLALSDALKIVFSYEVLCEDGALLSDVLQLQESFELQLSDSVPGFLDLVVLMMLVRLAVHDDLNQWNDFVGMLEAMRLAIVDGNISWLDTLVADLSQQLIAIDAFAQFDDQFVLNLITGSGLALADDQSLNWLDSFASRIGRGRGTVKAVSFQVFGQVNNQALDVRPQVGAATVQVAPQVGMTTLKIEQAVGNKNLQVEDEVQGSAEVIK